MLQDSGLWVASLPAALESELQHELKRILLYQIDKAGSEGWDDLLAESDVCAESVVQD